MLKTLERLGAAPKVRRRESFGRWLGRRQSRTDNKLIGLFGLFGTGNFGNDGSLEAMILFLQRVAPDEQLLCICDKPVEVRSAFRLDAVPIYYQAQHATADRPAGFTSRALGRATLWLYAMWTLRRLKMLIVPGTGVLDDFSVSPLGWPHDILSWWLLARLMGVKVVLASVGAGPIRHPLSRWLMKTAARAAHYRSYRDTVSKDFMEGIGFDTRNDPICPDIAFSLPAPASTRPKDDDSAHITVGLGVMTYHGWRGDRTGGAEIYNAYLEKITDFALWLLESGHVVRVLMGELSDRQAVDDLVRAVRAKAPGLADGSMLFAPAQTLHDVMGQMADTDFVVATRYHNVVCALKMGKPTISIGYASKNDALLTEMGLSDFCQNIESLDVDLLKRQTARLLAEQAFFKRGIRDVRTRFEHQLHDQDKILAALIGGLDH